MLFNRGQKFHVKNAEFFITIEGSMNGSQGIHRRYPSENHYDIDINGSRSFMSESQLLHLLKSNINKTEEENAKIKEEEIKKEEAKQKQIEKETKIEEKKDEEIIAERIVKPVKKGLFSWKNK